MRFATTLYKYFPATDLQYCPVCLKLLHLCNMYKSKCMVKYEGLSVHIL